MFETRFRQKKNREDSPGIMVSLLKVSAPTLQETVTGAVMSGILLGLGGPMGKLSAKIANGGHLKWW